MRKRRIVISAAMNDSQITALVQSLEPGHSSAEAEMTVDLANVLRGDAELGPELVIRVIAVRD